MRVDAGVHVPVPLQLVFIGAPLAADAAWHLRHLIELRAGAALHAWSSICFAAGEHAHLSTTTC